MELKKLKEDLLHLKYRLEKLEAERADMEELQLRLIMFGFDYQDELAHFFNPKIGLENCRNAFDHHLDLFINEKAFINNGCSTDLNSVTKKKIFMLKSLIAYFHIGFNKSNHEPSTFALNSYKTWFDWRNQPRFGQENKKLSLIEGFKIIKKEGFVLTPEIEESMPAMIEENICFVIELMSQQTLEDEKEEEILFNKNISDEVHQTKIYELSSLIEELKITISQIRDLMDASLETADIDLDMPIGTQGTLNEAFSKSNR